MKILEIFESIQGESSFAGLSCLFIRTSGCNLRCPWCDTKESWNIKNGKDYSITTLSNIIKKSKCFIIEITGGEPLLQIVELRKLLNKEVFKERFVLIESNGTIKVPNNFNSENLEFVKKVFFIFDVKPPEIKGGQFNISNLNLPFYELKFLVGNKKNIDFIYSFLEKNGKNIRPQVVINISPLFLKNDFFNYKWHKLLNDLKEKYPLLYFRLNVQIHKILGVK